MTSKRLGPLPRMRWAALGRGCGSGGQSGAAAAEGGRHLNPREGTVHDELTVLVTREEVVDVPGLGLGIGWECYVSCTRPGKKWLCTWDMKECFGNH